MGEIEGKKGEIELITDNIKALCKIHNMPICNLEKDLGRAKGYITHVKDGIRLREINQICNTFNVSINDLLEHDYTSDYEKMVKDKRIAELKAELEELEND